MEQHPIEHPVSDRSHSQPKYKGVRKRKWGKWVSEIRLPNSRERIWLGSYDTPEKAARAFDAAMFCLRGPNANFNFPDNPPDIADATSLTPSQIQVAAARFANSQPQIGHSAPSIPMESSSPSLSEGTVQTDSDITLNNLFSGLFTTTGSGNYASDYGIFPGFDDLTTDFYAPEMPKVDYGEGNMDGVIVQDSFLWNF